MRVSAPRGGRVSFRSFRAVALRVGGEDVLGSEFGGAGGVPDLRDLVADDFAHEALRRGRLALGGDREGAAGGAVRLLPPARLIPSPP